jgi:PTH1 family peptidyl-tRNA hydrolase
MSMLIVGLGNPGREYEHTRHNIGFDVLDHLKVSDRLIWKEKFKGVWASYGSGDDAVYFLKPQTFMNLSGESVQPLCKFFKILPEDVLVVHDELDLEYGSVGFKKFGGLAGHNGLKSIAQQLGTQNFLRFRMGIGRPERGSVSSYVLSQFGDGQAEFYEDYLKNAATALDLFMDKGFDAAGRKYSKKKLINL